MTFRKEEADLLRQRLNNFVHMVQNNHFYDAHETLEYSWKALRIEHPDEAKILKGLINGATALELKKRGREDASLRVWKTFEKYRPLIETVDSIFTKTYHTCTKILEEKHRELFESLLPQTKNI
ncbi:MAG: hypothetical protein B5M52_00520 [Helicobacteraceae bacterium 4484_230]|nr:MAG: hypothetical protein B5M52_00520 [Helicobacteraceae bacterium 4484_230]